jgi:hypothetical protein
MKKLHLLKVSEELLPFQTKLMLLKLQMARKMKGGFGEGNMFPLILSLLGLGVMIAIIALIPGKEKFVPVAPSASGDKKEVTASGNVILY